MLFNSFQFIFFFAIVTSLYFLLPHRYRWILLLAASCYFYMAFIPIYILILGFTIVIDYFAGILLEKTQEKQRKWFLIASLVANIGVLSVFKYYDFINDNLTALLHLFNFNHSLPILNIILPIGLSFHTFQAMSYTIEVYRGNQKAERNFGIYALYVMFYPQLVAGPIERPQNLIHQFYEKHYFNYERFIEGLKMMIWGLFMKVVIADRLAIYVNAVYNNPEQHTGATFVVATIFFAFQVYCDFAGYSNIAIGAAKVMGFNLMTNFNRPFFARSISEFWKRWHISLSTWFRDYLYIPLGGNRVGIPRWYFNLFIVFTISGLWHGANWNYIVWGSLTGFYLVFAIVTEKLRAKINKILYIDKFPRIKAAIQIFTTFGLTCFSFIIFRSNSMENALIIIKKLLDFSGPLFIGVSLYFIYSIIAIAVLIIIEIRREYFTESHLPFVTNHWFKEQLAYVSLIILIMMVGVFDGSQFIYFQF